MDMLRTSRRTLLGAGLAALLAITPATAAFAQGQGQATGRPSSGLRVPITGTTIAGTDPAQAIQNATLTIQRFAEQNGQLVAIGTVVGTVTNTLTGVTSTLVTPVAMPVNTNGATAAAAAAAATASCEILNLNLGPLDLNLLGLAVHLDPVVLDITAVPGAGNLLGNLLCAIAGLLDGPSPVAGLVGLLNNLLGALGGL